MIEKIGSAAVKYVPPALGVLAGYTISDIFGLANFIAEKMRGAGATEDVNRNAALLTSGIYFMVGIAVWRGLGGLVGNFIAGFVIGIALRVLIANLR